MEIFNQVTLLDGPLLMVQAGQLSIWVSGSAIGFENGLQGAQGRHYSRPISATAAVQYQLLSLKNIEDYIQEKK